ncbi:MAG TPA: hypothetical protein VJM83_06335 [Nitrospirota bacterium]|nr:hypothetical protein [Nitrospirota bacterium]
MSSSPSAVSDWKAVDWTMDGAVSPSADRPSPPWTSSVSMLSFLSVVFKSRLLVG